MDDKKPLAECDLTRRNDLDGRGTLSEEALTAFARFFLDVCLDQVRFMEQLMEPNRLRSRMIGWAEGELARGDVETLLETSGRTARRVTAALLERGVLTSPSSRAPLKLAFPVALASIWMPGLFPDQRHAQ